MKGLSAYPGMTRAREQADSPRLLTPGRSSSGTAMRPQLPSRSLSHPNRLPACLLELSPPLSQGSRAPSAPRHGCGMLILVLEQCRVEESVEIRGHVSKANLIHLEARVWMSCSAAVSTTDAGKEIRPSRFPKEMLVPKPVFLASESPVLPLDPVSGTPGPGRRRGRTGERAKQERCFSVLQMEGRRER